MERCYIFIVSKKTISGTRNLKIKRYLKEIKKEKSKFTQKYKSKFNFSFSASGEKGPATGTNPPRQSQVRSQKLMRMKRFQYDESSFFGSIRQSSARIHLHELLVFGPAAQIRFSQSPAIYLKKTITVAPFIASHFTFFPIFKAIYYIGVWLNRPPV